VKRDIQPYLRLLTELKQPPQHIMRMIYAPESDILTVHFREPNITDDSEMTEKASSCAMTLLVNSSA